MAKVIEALDDLQSRIRVWELVVSYAKTRIGTVHLVMHGGGQVDGGGMARPSNPPKKKGGFCS